jgi:hypothetical protein
MGRMEIMDSMEPEKVLVQLDFLKPVKNRHSLEFTLRPKDGLTEVTWAMAGPIPVIRMFMHLFLNMNNLIGRDLEFGLAMLKAVVEQGTP